MDIVKPIPPRSQIPIIYFHFSPDERVPMPSHTASNENITIPTGFPSTRPAMIPMLFDVAKLVSQPAPRIMQVLASAKTGSMKNATGL
jgi:hypothetical protein